MLIKHYVTPCLQFVDRNAVMDVLDVWKEFPGSGLPAAVAEDFLLDWSRSVLSHFAKPHTSTEDRLIALGQLAELLNRPQGSDGLWPCIATRKLLEAEPELQNRLFIAKHNARGVVMRAMDEGGQQERALARQYSKAAAQLARHWPATEKLLLRLANSYEHEAQGEDTTADAWKQEMTPINFPYGLCSL